MYGFENAAMFVFYGLLFVPSSFIVEIPNIFSLGARPSRNAARIFSDMQCSILVTNSGKASEALLLLAYVILMVQGVLLKQLM